MQTPTSPSAPPIDYLSRPILMHICRDGTITYRSLSEKVFNGVALPFFSVDTKDQAKRLQVMLCKSQYERHPKLPNQPWYAFPGFRGELDDMDRVAGIFAEAYANL
jgi:hypothetical protein